MINMEMLGKIRRMHLRDKVSLHEIAKRTGLSRNTVRSWLREPGDVQEPVYSRAPVFSKLSGFAAELERSLAADAQRAKQNRRTARALFVQIKLSGYEGGYSRVTDFIRAWRSDAGKGVKAFVPLRFELGEAFQPAPLQRLRQGLMQRDGGDKIMAQVLNCVTSHGLPEVLVAVELVIESGVLSTEHVLNVLARLNAAELPPNVQTSLQLKEVPLANTGRYDSLRGGGNDNAVEGLSHA